MRALALALALAFVAGGAAAQEASPLAPDAAPSPAARPEGGDAAPELRVPPIVAPTTAEEPEGAGDGSGPSPPEGMPPLPGSPEPEEAPGPDVAPADGPAPDAGPAAAAVEEPEPAPVEAPRDLAACLVALDAAGARYDRPAPVVVEGRPDCGIPSPVVLRDVRDVAFEPAEPMRCATALAAARWAGEVVEPLARLLGRGAVTAIEQAPAATCRPRADGQPSEHATGHALDVVGFRFAAGDPIPVEPRAGDGTLEEAFQRAVRAGACLAFTTVLGPGEPDHETHLHLDVKARGGGFRICQ